MEGVEKPLKLHFIPWLAQGHMIPLCDIATLFASRGHQVTIISTPSNVQALNKSIPTHQSKNLHIHTISFPSEEVGLSKGVESLSTISDTNQLPSYYHALALIRPLIEEFVELDPPDCIVGDFMFPWVHELSNKLHIPRLSFTPLSLFNICAMNSVIAHYSYGEEDSGSFIIPDFPHHITLNTRPPKSLSEGMLKEALEIQLKSFGLLVNNFTEFDGEEYIDYYEKTTNHKAWHIGPVSLIRKTAQEKASRGQQSTLSLHECLDWLNSKKDKSVLYLSFGSICFFSNKQLYEIASALDALGYNFIWVVPEKRGKENESEEEKEKWLPKGFEERWCIGKNKKGLIIKGWAPQVVILEHPAIGAFITHCGWNSIMEAVSVALPMITWPIQADQFYNEKLLTQVRRIGVEVGTTKWCEIGIMDEDGVVVSRDNIEKAVRRLMDGGDEAEEIRRRAREFKDKAKAAVQEGGSSHRNLTALIDELKRLRDQKH